MLVTPERPLEIREGRRMSVHNLAVYSVFRGKSALMPKTTDPTDALVFGNEWGMRLSDLNAAVFARIGPQRPPDKQHERDG